MKKITNKMWSTMPVHKADEDIWKGIENHIKTNPVANKGNKPFVVNTKSIYARYLKYIYISGIALTIGVFLYLLNCNNKTNDKVSSNVINHNKTLDNNKDVKTIDNKENNTKNKNSENNDLSESLLAYYPCDGNVLDLSGNNVNGTLHGPTYTTDRFNKPNKALLFKEYGEYIDVPSDLWCEKLTLSAWINVNDFGSVNSEISGREIFFKAPNMSYNQDYNLLVFYDENGNPRAQFYFGQSSTQFVPLKSKTILQTNKWYLITATRANGVAKIYINGNLDATATYSFIPANQHFKLKLGMSHSSEQSFNGKLDELKIYERALTAKEVQNLYHEGNYK